MPSVRKALAEIERAGAVLIKELFVKPGVITDMPVPVFTVQRRGRKHHGDGWYVPESWESRGSNVLSALAGRGKKPTALDELTIAAESLNAKPLEILHTLHHELAHHACRLNGVRDFAQNGVYHMEGFGSLAKRSGLKVERDDGGNRGFALTKPNTKTLQVYRDIDLDPSVFNMYRLPEEEVAEAARRTNGGPRPTKGRYRNPNKKWTCTKCGFNVRVGGQVGNMSPKPCMKGCGGVMLYNDHCRGCGALFQQPQSNVYCPGCGVAP